MNTVTRASFIRDMASMFKLSIPAMARKVSEVSAELELNNVTRFSLRVAGEMEAIISRDLKAGN